MLETTEIRWFFRGKMPLAVINWNRDLRWVSAEEPRRTDIYLSSAGLPGLGIKWRQGKLECKQKIGGRHLVELGNGSAGYWGHWCKWGFEALDGAAGADLPKQLFSDRAYWVPVQKIRAQCFVRWPHMVESSAPSWEPGVVNCGIEWATVDLEGEAWWTFGLEASGDADRRESALLEIAQVVLESEGAPAMAAEHSMSYPRWISEAASKKG